MKIGTVFIEKRQLSIAYRAQKIEIRDFFTQSKKSAIVFQMKMDPGVMWERRVSTLWRGRMIKMSDFFTKSKKIRSCLLNVDGPV